MTDKCDKTCKFEPRYDSRMPDNYTIPDNDDYLTDTDDFIRLIDALKSQTYVHDICTSCGTVIRRD